MPDRIRREFGVPATLLRGHPVLSWERQLPCEPVGLMRSPVAIEGGCGVNSWRI